jgi:hypothetical protein
MSHEHINHYFQSAGKGSLVSLAKDSCLIPGASPKDEVVWTDAEGSKCMAGGFRAVREGQQGSLMVFTMKETRCEETASKRIHYWS